MGFATSPFGKADGSNVDGTVVQHYGEREREDGIAAGGELAGGEGAIKEAVLFAKASDFTIDDATNASFVSRFSLPAGAVPIDCIFEVSEAFTQTGGTTSTTLNVGTSGSEGTNGFTITDAATSLAIVTEVDAAGDGTWAGVTPVNASAATVVGVQLTLGGGTVTAVTAGAAKIVIRYRKV